MSLDKLKRGYLICRIAAVLLTIIGGIFVFTLVNADYTTDISWGYSIKYVFLICYVIIAIFTVYFYSEIKKAKTNQTEDRIKVLEKEVARLKNK